VCLDAEHDRLITAIAKVGASTTLFMTSNRVHIFLIQGATISA